ncbi:uncharacterized protein LOC108864263 [Galendromus occidentalis]|uniref:Uncharacterized protein LOC108864263 n=1 Tax=Galendromus occidentalis TaxID=34638 RepID=A0AAJ7WHS3_9ACAR|nr:uncharacterized protein LOC108864263 [Galendromus occidentalis]
MFLLSVVLVGLLISTGSSEDSPLNGPQEGVTDRPAMQFCSYASGLIEMISDTLEFYKTVHPKVFGDDELQPFSTGNTTFKFPFATIYGGELYNFQNFYINDSTTISCDDDQMNVRLVFGIKDPILKSKFKTPIGIRGDAEVNLSLFEADVRAILPRTTNRVLVDRVTILRMENLHIDVSESLSEYSTLMKPLNSLRRGGKTVFGMDTKMDLTKVANLFLKNTPKKMLFPIMESFVKSFAQQYLNQNPVPI